MPAIQSPRDRSARSGRWVAAWLLATWTAIAIAPIAVGQVPGPESFAVAPKTPIEFWSAANYLVTTGQAELAVPYLKSFIQSKPDDATLLEIQDRFGTRSIFRLQDYRATQPYVQPLMAMLTAAARRHATDPQRIARALARLSGTRIEHELGVQELRQAGPYAVPPLVAALTRPGLSAEQRGALAVGLGQLDSSAVPALLAVLDSPDTVLASDAVAALGRIGDRRAVPRLTYLAATDNPLRVPARRAIEQITGRSFDAQPKPPVRVLTETAWQYHRHAVAFPSETVALWEWVEDAPTPRQVSRREAETLLGLRHAREALAIAPNDESAQVALVSLALEDAVARVGLSRFPTHDPTGAFSTALAAGPTLLGQVLRAALADGHSELAAAAATALGRVADRDALPTGPRPHPLVEALSAPDRRVQFAAARALVELDPRQPFPGSSRVVPVLARFVQGQAAPQAVIIDGNPNRGSRWVRDLRGLGYDPLLATTGAQGFRLAAEAADVELVLVEPDLPQGSWRMIDTLSNLRADARTAGLPVLIVSPAHPPARLIYYSQAFPRVAFLVATDDRQFLKRQLERALAKMGARPLAEAERGALAQSAAVLLARIAQQPGSPFERDLPTAAPALEIALGTPPTSLPASTALGDVPGVDTQRSLADVVLDPAKPVPLRLVSADQLTRSIQRFGPLLSSEQERRLVERLNGETDPALRTALAEVFGALRPDAQSVGQRLQSFTGPTPSRGAAPEAPQPAPAPEAVPAPQPEEKP
jgi:HEAT repeat protein/CheY-like chemotaxis protein